MVMIMILLMITKTPNKPKSTFLRGYQKPLQRSLLTAGLNLKPTDLSLKSLVQLVLTHPYDIPWQTEPYAIA